MIKKPKRVFDKRNKQEHDEIDDDSINDDIHKIDAESKKMIVELQEKVATAAVLNGGFDRLYMKIESIESNQHQIAERVDSIHDAIFNPDQGLFSRIAQTKIEQIEVIADVDKQLASIITWKEQQDKLTEKDATTDTKVSETIRLQQKSIDEIVKWKSTVSSIGKWFAVAVVGASISLLFKLLYDAIILHWK